METSTSLKFYQGLVCSTDNPVQTLLGANSCGAVIPGRSRLSAGVIRCVRADFVWIGQTDSHLERQLLAYEKLDLLTDAVIRLEAIFTAIV